MASTTRCSRDGKEYISTDMFLIDGKHVAKANLTPEEAARFGVGINNVGEAPTGTVTETAPTGVMTPGPEESKDPTEPIDESPATNKLERYQKMTEEFQGLTDEMKQLGSEDPKYKVLWETRAKLVAAMRSLKAEIDSETSTLVGQ